jgi:hypothetical protein
MQYCTKCSWPVSAAEADKMDFCEHLGLYSSIHSENEINGYCFLNEKPITKDRTPLKRCPQ